MCPIDPTPHAGEVMHEPEKQFPKPTPDVAPDVDHEPKPKAPDDAQMQNRPPIPARSETMAVDIEDEDADPVVESGPGLEKRQTSLFTRD